MILVKSNYLLGLYEPRLTSSLTDSNSNTAPSEVDWPLRVTLLSITPSTGEFSNTTTSKFFKLVTSLFNATFWAVVIEFITESLLTFTTDRLTDLFNFNSLSVNLDKLLSPASTVTLIVAWLLPSFHFSGTVNVTTAGTTLTTSSVAFVVPDTVASVVSNSTSVNLIVPTNDSD